MTKKILSSLNLPDISDVIPEVDMPVAQPKAASESTASDDMKAMVSAAEAMTRKLRLIDGTEHTGETDELAREGLDKARELFDYAYNSDPRSARGIMEIAAAMYKFSLDAVNSKRDAQLKAMKLMQDQQRIDNETKKLLHTMGEIVPTETVQDADVTFVGDRNELVKKYLEGKVTGSPPELK